MQPNFGLFGHFKYCLRPLPVHNELYRRKFVLESVMHSVYVVENQVINQLSVKLLVTSCRDFDIEAFWSKTPISPFLNFGLRGAQEIAARISLWASYLPRYPAEGGILRGELSLPEF